MAVACCSPSCTPSTSAGWARRCATRCRTCTCRCPARCCPRCREYERFATTAADAYLAPRARPRTSSGWPTRGAEAPASRAARHAVLGRRRRLDAAAALRLGVRALRPRRRRRRRGAVAARPAASRRADLRHGRDEHRRGADRRRRGADHDGAVVAGVPLAPPDGRRPHRQRRRRLDRRARRGRRAARRAALRRRRPGPGRLRPRRHGADGHRRATCCSGYLADGARLGGEVELDREAADAAVAALGREARPRRPGDRARHRRAWPTPRWCARCA